MDSEVETPPPRVRWITRCPGVDHPAQEIHFKLMLVLFLLHQNKYTRLHSCYIYMNLNSVSLDRITTL